MEEAADAEERRIGLDAAAGAEEDAAAGAEEDAASGAEEDAADDGNDDAADDGADDGNDVEEDDQIPDREEDIRPRFHKSKSHHGGGRSVRTLRESGCLPSSSGAFHVQGFGVGERILFSKAICIF